MSLLAALLVLGTLPPAPPAGPQAPTGPQAPDAMAAPAVSPGFGDRGTFAPSGVISVRHSVYGPTLVLTSSPQTVPPTLPQTVPQTAQPSVTTVSFAPGVDYFVLDRLSIMISVLAEYSAGAGWHGYALGTTLGAGYYFPINERFGLYPRASFTSVYEKTIYTGAPGIIDPYISTGGTRSSVYADFELPVLVHFGQFFLGLGPRLTQRLSRSAVVYEPNAALRTRIQLVTMIGGWID